MLKNFDKLINKLGESTVTYADYGINIDKYEIFWILELIEVLCYEIK